MKQAEWNDITWGGGNKQLILINRISLSQGLKTEQKEDGNGNNKTVIKGLDNEALEITYKAGFAVGSDPRGEYEMLKKCAGMQDDFIFAGEKLGSEQFELDEIELANTILDNSGRILAGDLTLRFNTESAPSSKGGKGAKKKKSGKGKKGKKGSLTLSNQIKAMGG